jgi:hypothetical protein
MEKIAKGDGGESRHWLATGYSGGSRSYEYFLVGALLY